MCAGVALYLAGPDALAAKGIKLLARTLTTLAQADAKWSDGPEASVKVAHIYGDPDQPGMFIQWMRLPPGMKTPAHWHRGDETITVLSGSIFMASGDKPDETAGVEIKAGGFAVMPALSPHYGWSKSGAVIQVQGVGPFSMNWIEK